MGGRLLIVVGRGVDLEVGVAAQLTEADAPRPNVVAIHRRPTTVKAATATTRVTVDSANST